MTMGLTRMGWRAYDAVPEPDVPHDQAHQIDLRARAARRRRARGRIATPPARSPG